MDVARHRIGPNRLPALLFALLLALLWATTAPASTDPATALPVAPNSARLALGPAIRYWCDGDGQASLEQAREAPLAVLGKPQIAFGYRADACWFHFTLANQAAEPAELLLLIDYALLDQVDLYGRSAGEAQHWSMGDLHAFSQRPLGLRNFTVPLTLLAEERADYWLRVQTTSSMTVPLTVSGHLPFLEYHLKNDWLLGLFYGIGFGLFCYHLVLWVVARESIYRFYIIHVGASVGYLATLQGVTQRLWPDGYTAPDNFAYVIGYVALLSATLFAREFLITREWRRLDGWLKGLAWLLAGVMTLQLILPAGSVTRLMAAMALLTMLSLLFSGSYSWLRGRAQARIFVLAWLVFLAMVGLLALNVYGVVPQLPIIVTLFGMHIGIVLQQILLSLGLAARITALKKESLLRDQVIARAQAESAAKGDFLARMSHEIRTPMNAVLALTELLGSTRLDERQRQYVSTISSAGENLLSVINDILDYSKITAGKLQLEQQNFNLNKVLEDCVTIMGAAAQQKHLQLELHKDSRLPAWLTGDPVRIKQVLLNLLSNAIKFTEQGFVRLAAEVDLLSSKQVRLHFQVRDTGIGMNQSQLQDLFGSFQQADSSTSRKYGGTGLGLAISKQLVELMGGVIEVDTTPGAGTCFGFRIWLARGEPMAEVVARSNEALSGLRVLVVEDNAVNQMVIAALLAELDVQAHIVGSGEEALAALAEMPLCCDLVLMDCEMPGMDGYQTTAQIRRLDSPAAHLPIVALTAHALQEHRERCLAAGMDDHLAKPLSLDRMQQTLARWRQQTGA